MTIGIIGGTGFVGKNLSNYYIKNNVRHETTSRRYGVDATNKDEIVKWAKEYDINILVNLAAECGGIGLNKRKPADLWLSSTKISSAILEAALELRLDKLIMVGTACSYAKDCPVPFKESDLMNHGFPEPTNASYGVSKLNTLFGSLAFCKQYGLNICNLIPVNMYGPYDHFDLENSHVVPAMIRKIDNAIMNKADITLWGTGSATREFLYAEDFAVAVTMAIDHLDTPEFINVGYGSEISMKELANEIADIMGFDGEIIWDTSMPDGQPRRSLDVSKARTTFGFSAQTKLKDGLKKTITWYKENKCHL